MDITPMEAHESHLPWTRQTLCNTGQAAGTWNRMDYSLGKVPAPGGLYRVSAAGGVPVSSLSPFDPPRAAQSACFCPMENIFSAWLGPRISKVAPSTLRVDSKSKSRARATERPQYAPAYAPARTVKGYLLFFRETP